MTKKTTLTFDLECTTKSSYQRKANPFDPRNKVVICSYKYGDGETQVDYYEPNEPLKFPSLENVSYLIGFNIKFDLLYVWADEEVRKFFKDDGKIWCCQYAEYLLTGQQELYPSLDGTCVKYGGKVKNTEVKAMWEAGYDTYDIPKETLLPYAHLDVENTYLCFKGQVTECRERGIVKSIQARMDGLCATTDMEFNGIYTNKEIAIGHMEDLNKKLAEYENDIIAIANGAASAPGFNFNIGSGHHLSALLFGGTVKYTVKEHQRNEDGSLKYSQLKESVPELNEDGTPVLYRSGKNKGLPKFKTITNDNLEKPVLRNVNKTITFPGITSPDPRWATKIMLEDSPVYNTGSDVLVKIKKADKERTGTLVALLLKWRAVDKDLGTYYERDGKGMLTLVYPDGRLHHKLNHCATKTTRLSSTSPNGQNFSKKGKSKVKELFSSRFGVNGVMIEEDYSQLEVVVQGVMANDTELLKDIATGIDFHCKRLSIKLNRPYDEIYRKHHVEHDEEIGKLRTGVKAFSFQLSYGAGAAKISESTGMSEEDVKELIKLEKETYPGVNGFNEAVKQSVESTSTPTKRTTKDGHTIEKGYWISPTGTTYVFSQYDAPIFLQKRGTFVSYKPTEMKNYPIQGTAGEFVQLALGKLWRRFVATNNYGGKAFLVNTVHDCVWIDAHKDVHKEVAFETAKLLSGIPQYAKDTYNMDITVEFGTSIEVGQNMLSLKPLERINE